jgi:hypothetical protein
MAVLYQKPLNPQLFEHKVRQALKAFHMDIEAGSVAGRAALNTLTLLDDILPGKPELGPDFWNALPDDTPLTPKLDTEKCLMCSAPVVPPLVLCPDCLSEVDARR